MKRIQLTPTVLVLILISSLITNVSVWKMSGSIQTFTTQGEKDVAKRTFGPVNVDITLLGIPVTIPVSVIVTQGEDVPENEGTPSHEDETSDELDERGLDALIKAMKATKDRSTPAP